MQLSLQEMYYGLGIVSILACGLANLVIAYRTHTKAWEAPMEELSKAFVAYQHTTDGRVKEIETHQRIIVDGLGELRAMLLDKSRNDASRDERLDAKITELYKVLLHAQWKGADDDAE